MVTVGAISLEFVDWTADLLTQLSHQDGTSLNPSTFSTYPTRLHNMLKKYKRQVMVISYQNSLPFVLHSSLGENFGGSKQSTYNKEYTFLRTLPLRPPPHPKLAMPILHREAPQKTRIMTKVVEKNTSINRRHQ